MKLASLIIFLFLSGVSTGQIFEALDKNKVFEDFVFGSPAERYNGDLKLDLIISYGTKYYKYTGKSLSHFETFKTHDINVGFNQNRLHYLDIYFKNLDDQAFEKLLHSLEEKYGPSQPFTALDKGVDATYEWIGDNISIQLCKYNKEASDFDDRNMTVLIVSLNKQ